MGHDRVSKLTEIRQRPRPGLPVQFWAGGVVHRLSTKREAHNERRVNWCSKRGARAACFDKRLIGLQKPVAGSWRARGATRAAARWRYEAEAAPTDGRQQE